MNCKTTTRSLVSCSTRVPEGQGSYHSDTQSDVTSWTAGTSNSQFNASPIGALLTRGCVKGSTQESVVAEQAMLILFHRKTASNCILYISKQSFFFCPTLLGTVASRHQYLLPVESRSQLCVASANVEPQPEVIETSSF